MVLQVRQIEQGGILGHKVCNNLQCFSNKLMTEEEAEKQRIAIILNYKNLERAGGLAPIIPPAPIVENIPEEIPDSIDIGGMDIGSYFGLPSRRKQAVPKRREDFGGTEVFINEERRNQKLLKSIEKQMGGEIEPSFLMEAGDDYFGDYVAPQVPSRRKQAVPKKREEVGLLDVYVNQQKRRDDMIKSIDKQMSGNIEPSFLMEGGDDYFGEFVPYKEPEVEKKKKLIIKKKPVEKGYSISQSFEDYKKFLSSNKVASAKVYMPQIQKYSPVDVMLVEQMLNREFGGKDRNIYKIGDNSVKGARSPIVKPSTGTFTESLANQNGNSLFIILSELKSWKGDR